MEVKFSTANEAAVERLLAGNQPPPVHRQGSSASSTWAVQALCLFLPLILASLVMYCLDGATLAVSHEWLQHRPVQSLLLLCALCALVWMFARTMIGETQRGSERVLQLAADNAALVSILRWSPVAQLIYEVSTDKLQYANEAACSMFGWSQFRDDQQLMAVLGVAAESARSASLKQILHSDQSFRDVELRLPRPGGGLLEVQVMGSPIDLKGNRCTLLQLVDCTDRKQYEMELQRSRDSYRSVFLNGPNPCSMTSVEGAVINEVNEAWLALFGYSRREVMGRSLDEIQLWGDPKERVDLEKSLLESGSLRGVECRHMSKDGDEIDVLLSAEVIEAGGEKLLLWQEADITDRKRFERAIQRLNTELESRVEQRTLDLSEVNSQLESFSYSIAHDLRAPLRAIDGFTVLLAKEHARSLDEGGILYLSKVQANVARMTALINDLLAFAKAGRGEMECASVNVGRLASDVAAELAPINPTARIQVSELPPALANASLLRQVIHNLVANALKFSRDNPAARVEIGSLLLEGNVVYFVKDNGVGFDMRHAGKLFGVFQRLHGSKEFDGTGVGLAIAARIVQRHGGRIWAEAAVGTGATFFFQLQNARTSESGRVTPEVLRKRCKMPIGDA